MELGRKWHYKSELAGDAPPDAKAKAGGERVYRPSKSAGLPSSSDITPSLRSCVWAIKAEVMASSPKAVSMSLSKERRYKRLACPKLRVGPVASL